MAACSRSLVSDWAASRGMARWVRVGEWRECRDAGRFELRHLRRTDAGHLEQAVRIDALLRAAIVPVALRALGAGRGRVVISVSRRCRPLREPAEQPAEVTRVLAALKRDLLARAEHHVHRVRLGLLHLGQQVAIEGELQHVARLGRAAELGVDHFVAVIAQRGGAPRHLAQEVGVYYRSRQESAFKFKGFWAHSRPDEKLAFEQFMDWLDRAPAQAPVPTSTTTPPTRTPRSRSSRAATARARPCSTSCCASGAWWISTRWCARRSGPRRLVLHQGHREFYRGARQATCRPPAPASSTTSAISRPATRRCSRRSTLQRGRRGLDAAAARVAAEPPPHRDAVARLRARRGLIGIGHVVGEPSPKLQAYLNRVEAVRTRCPPRRRPRATRWPTCSIPPPAGEASVVGEVRPRRLAFDDLVKSVDGIAGSQRVPGTQVDEYEYPAQEIKFDADDYVVWLEHPDGALLKLLEVDEDRRRVRPGTREGVGRCPTPERGPAAVPSIASAERRPAPRRPERGGRRPSVPCDRSVLAEGHPATHGARTRRADRERRHRAARTDHRRRAPARRQLSVHPGSARRGQDVHRLARDRGAAAEGKRVAVSSNSHKAINNLLAAVEKVLLRTGKSQCAPARSRTRGTIRRPQRAADRRHRRQGRSALAPMAVDGRHRVAVLERGPTSIRLPVRRRGRPGVRGQPRRDGPCAKNIVLLGDQMQLGQPIQGTHPGRSGDRRWSTCWTGTRPCRRSAASSCRPRGACARTCAGSSPTPSTTAAWSPSRDAKQTLVLGAKRARCPAAHRLVFWPWTTRVAGRSPRRKRRRSSGSSRACSSRAHGSIATG